MNAFDLFEEDLPIDCVFGLKVREKDDIRDYDYFFGHKQLFCTLYRKTNAREKKEMCYLFEKSQKKWNDMR